MKVRSWATGDAGSELPPEEDEDEDLPLIRPKPKKDYLAKLMMDAKVERLELGSKFEWVIDIIKNTDKNKLLVFSSW